MKSFKTFLTEGATHSTHLEDLILDLGVVGTKHAIDALVDFKTAFSSKSNTKNFNVSTKWDGAPAVVFGTDPVTKKFFVGSKNAFSKTNPKMSFTHKDIDEQYNAGPAGKLHEALDYLPKVTPKGRVFQGDFLYSKSELKSVVVNGEKVVIMHPNTIAYYVPAASDLGAEISSAKMGIVVHTEYHGGPELHAMSASFGVDVSAFKNSKDVWLTGALFNDDSGKGNLTADETSALNSAISDAKSLLSSTATQTFEALSSSKMNAMVHKFNNSIVKIGSAVEPKVQADKFIEWIGMELDKNAATLKSGAGKEKAEENKRNMMSMIDKSELTKVFALQQAIVRGKSIVIKKLNDMQTISTLVQTKDGYKVTGHEGFVGLSGDIAGVKLVDRLVFSHLNFNADIIKGWAH